LFFVLRPFSSSVAVVSLSPDFYQIKYRGFLQGMAVEGSHYCPSEARGI